jgi:hypothetical protein
MNEKQLITERLYRQQLSVKKFTKPEEVVAHFGAVQAQDYYGSLWAIALRMKNHVTEASIEQAILDRKIIRSWPMRGTLHFATPARLPWMLKYLTPRVISRAASVYRAAGLDKSVFSKSEKIVQRALEQQTILTRTEMYAELDRAGIETSNTRGLHVLGVLAQQGLICLAPRRDKQPTFTLMDKWIEPKSTPSFEDGLAPLTNQYFTSHGPATLKDFMWWSGLTKAEALAGIEMSKLIEFEIYDQTFFTTDDAPRRLPKSKNDLCELLPFWDEYTVAYQLRDMMLNEKHIKKHRGKLLSSVIMINGKIVGTWKRAIKNAKVELKMSAFQKFNPDEKEWIKEAAARYGRFLDKDVVIKW